MKNREKKPTQKFSPAFFPLVARPSNGLGNRVTHDEHTEDTWLSFLPQTCAALAGTCPGLAEVTLQELLPTTTEHPAPATSLFTSSHSPGDSLCHLGSWITRHCVQEFRLKVPCLPLRYFLLILHYR